MPGNLARSEGPPKNGADVGIGVAHVLISHASVCHNPFVLAEHSNMGSSNSGIRTDTVCAPAREKSA